MFDGLCGRKVYIVLKNGRKYQAVVQSSSGNILIIKDKFNATVYISADEISFLEEER